MRKWQKKAGSLKLLGLYFQNHQESPGAGQGSKSLTVFTTLLKSGLGLPWLFNSNKGHHWVKMFIEVLIIWPCIFSLFSIF